MVQSGNPVPPLIIMMDPPQHRRMRNLVNKVFTPRAIERQRRLVVEQIERFLAAADPVEFDVVQDFSALFPVEVITRLLGVPAELRQKVRLLLDKTLEREYGNVATPEEGVRAGIETGLIYYNIIQERHANPQDDMISDLIAAEVERDGVATKLDDVEIAGFASMLGGRAPRRSPSWWATRWSLSPSTQINGRCCSTTAAGFPPRSRSCCGGRRLHSTWCGTP